MTPGTNHHTPLSLSAALLELISLPFVSKQGCLLVPAHRVEGTLCVESYQWRQGRLRMAPGSRDTFISSFVCEHIHERGTRGGKERRRFLRPGAGVTGGCELPAMGCGNCTEVLWKSTLG